MTRNEILNEVIASLASADGIGSRQEAVAVVEAMKARELPKQPLTNRQVEVFRFIHAYHRKFNFSPTMREIAEHFGFHQNAAQCFIKHLTEKGWLKRAKTNAARNYAPV